MGVAVYEWPGVDVERHVERAAAQSLAGHTDQSRAGERDACAAAGVVVEDLQEHVAWDIAADPGDENLPGGGARVAKAPDLWWRGPDDRSNGRGASDGCAGYDRRDRGRGQVSRLGKGRVLGEPLVKREQVPAGEPLSDDDRAVAEAVSVGCAEIHAMSGVSRRSAAGLRGCGCGGGWLGRFAVRGSIYGGAATPSAFPVLGRGQRVVA